MSNSFASLVDRVAQRLMPVPVVSEAAYRAIECNRCGLCCEDIPSDHSPDELAVLIGDASLDSAKRRFLSGLVPVGPTRGGWSYRCRHFYRDERGLGVCGIHETRPEVCRRFPYDGVVRRWTECAWYVQIRGADGSILPMMPDADTSWAVRPADVQDG